MNENETRLWPFLVAAGRSVGNKLVISPRFLHERGREGLLWRALNQATLEPDSEIRIVRVRDDDPAIQQFYVAFDVRLARREADEASAYFEDQFSRPIRMVEGVVITGAGDGAKFAEHEMQKLRPLLHSVFLEFWEVDNIGSSRLWISRPFVPGCAPELSLIERMTDDGGNSVALSRSTAVPEPDDVADEKKPRSRCILAAAVTAAIIAGLAVLFWYLYSRGHHAGAHL